MASTLNAKNVYFFRTNILIKLQNVENKNTKEQSTDRNMPNKNIQNIEGITIDVSNVER
jgi:hypothetical protein